LKIPKQIKVAGQIYKVEYPYYFKEIVLTGQTDCLQKVIRITNVDKTGIKLPEQVIEETFLHEILHAVDSEYNNLQTPDDQIARLSNGLYQVLRDNDISFRK